MSVPKTWADHMLDALRYGSSVIYPGGLKMGDDIYCDYCSKLAESATGQDIYYGRTNYDSLLVWTCMDRLVYYSTKRRCSKINL